MDYRTHRLLPGLISCILLCGCHSGHEQASPATLNPSAPSGQVSLDATQVASLHFAQAQMRILNDWLDVPAQIDADANHTLPVYSSYTGRIVQCSVEVGTRVKRGDVLFSISSSDLIQAQSTFLSAVASQHLTEKAVQRAKSLIGIQEIAQKDLEQAQSDYATATANIQAARQTLISMGLAETQIHHLEQSGKVDRVLTVTSPMNGLVIDRQAQVGLLTQPGSSPAPVTLEATDQLWIDAALPENATEVHPGASFKAHPLSLPHLALEGNIVYKAYSEDPQSHTLLVRAILANPSAQLHPGMLLSMQIQNGTGNNVLAVPDDAIVHEPDGGSTVWTTTDRLHFRAHPVHTGISDAGWTEILDGISPESTVVTEGAINLSNIIHASGDD